MPYHSSAREVSIYAPPFTRRVPWEAWVAFKKLEAVRYVAHFLELQPTVRASEEGTSLVTGVRFLEGEVGYAHSLDSLLPRFAQAFLELSGVELMGSFLLSGEEFRDFARYDFGPGARVAKREGVVTYSDPVFLGD